MNVKATPSTDSTVSILHAESWPSKYDLFGVHVSSTNYANVVDVLIRAGKSRLPVLVDFTPVSVLVEGARDLMFRSKLNSFDLVCPDGQPVRWCLNYFYATGLRDRVCGTTTMLRLCEAAAAEDLGIYLYGSTPETLQALEMQLTARFPTIRIVGSTTPPFRLLTNEETDAAIRQINESGAAFLFVGLGSPKQENFVWEHKSRINAVQLCVGAAFDFIAGTRKRAPVWMQRSGLEWFHRMLNEPARLGKRYLFGNAHFLVLLLAEIMGVRRPGSEDPSGASGCRPA
jgi:N-acetylglucosaminyldiphosphoundecaprenol N-acetyl-beta-D-mannosaminyltransferase